ncbi:MAG: DUF58 domain-containing protein [Oscillospiraceae bacterium]|nr:DUF58 domain-containing protein [Oscillospiraceae bacterium]
MALNRFLYCMSLLLAVVFYFASSAWASWVLLLMIAVLPWVSLIFSLPAILTCRITASLQAMTEQGERTLLHIQVSSLRWLAAPEMRLQLNLRSRDQERNIRFLSHLSRTDGILAVPTQDCGWLKPEFSKGKVYDFLGLFRFKVRVPEVAPMAILPPALVPDPMPDLEQLLNQQLKPKPGGGYSEIHDHRPYRPGDPVKGIHWKLSVKSDELIVREPMDPIRRQVLLAVRTPRGPVCREKTLGNLRYLSNWLLERGISHEVVWMEGDRLRKTAVEDEASALAALAGACLAPEDSLKLPDSLPYKADWLCRIGEEADQ